MWKRLNIDTLEEVGQLPNGSVIYYHINSSEVRWQLNPDREDDSTTKDFISRPVVPSNQTTYS